MKKILYMLALMLSLNAFAYTSCDDFSKLNASQIQVLKMSHEIGKEHDYEWTLPAIAWIESTGGMYLYNEDIRGDSHGIYQSLLDNVLYREYNMRISSSNPDVIIAPKWLQLVTRVRLKFDIYFAAKHAVQELDFWKGRTRSDRALWASYNSGYHGVRRFNSSTPPPIIEGSYSNKIYKTIRLLRRCETSPLYVEKKKK